MKNFYSYFLAASTALFLSPTAFADNIYLVGVPQGWDIESDSMPLPETSSGVYEAKFNINAGEFWFRFYSQLGDWDSHSIGAGEGDVDISIELVDNTWYSGFYVDGKGNWMYPYWEGGELYITVDTNKKTVVFTSDPNAAIETPMPDMYIRGANINGADGWGAVNKMTYDYSTGVYTWSASELGSGFKFADDPGWNGSYNIGSNGSPISVGTPYTYYNGSDSGNILFSSNAEVVYNPEVVLDVNKGTILLTGAKEEQEISLTLAGSFNDWLANDSEYELLKNDDGTYSGTFFMYGDIDFQVVLLGSTWYGNTGQAEVDMSASDSITVNLGTGYENNFTLTGWDDGELNFTVTMDGATPKTLTVTNENAGVESLLQENPASLKIYNLQGLPVSPSSLSPGLYIINGKKILIK